MYHKAQALIKSTTNQFFQHFGWHTIKQKIKQNIRKKIGRSFTLGASNSQLAKFAHQAKTSILLLCLFTSLPSSAERLITAGGTITEIVYALGAGDQIVAVDQSSTYPAAATKLPMIGYYRDLASEGVLAQNADMLLAIEGVGRANVLKQIASVGVQVKVLNKPESVEELYALIDELALILNKPAQAKALKEKIAASLPEKQQLGGNAVFLLSVGSRGLVAAGQDTVPNLLFDYLGINNIAGEHNGYKTLGREALLTANPDFIVAASHSVVSLGGKQAFCQQAALALVPAATKCRLLVVDGLKVLGMTTRLAEALAEVKTYALTLYQQKPDGQFSTKVSPQ
ncbi:heme/hemin ABC transporter substrate-binding protein [Thalassotalea euphylliae]|uniref:Hemin ABC transporter substrate-binding protein n=1 Tax=Thalassotalea euphylliae TaxID=1655234 RepID=A0A3E0U200_9GAMM|nr:ABC transporter substrate-binding protein [Thalassotalea euphylliae]REL30062.1 hemin ABC transporter substrate-binding protein [Thalassotalea euphylliae]